MAADTDYLALAAYRQEKLQLGEYLVALMHAAQSRHDDERAAHVRELAARLAEDRFQLAVMGQFSRGKSTLMNAILGGPYLPTGARPMTSVITSVVYGQPYPGNGREGWGPAPARGVARPLGELRDGDRRQA